MTNEKMYAILKSLETENLSDGARSVLFAALREIEHDIFLSNIKKENKTNQ